LPLAVPQTPFIGARFLLALHEALVPPFNPEHTQKAVFPCVGNAVLVEVPLSH
jgi:hypothetical protein